MGMSSDHRHSVPVWAAVVSVALIVLAGYSFMLSNFFTGTDSLTLIETSRIQNLGDALRILTEPLMAGSRFLEVAKFYRPISILSYSLDSSIWNLDPFGYQLTNLALHVLACILVFFLVRKLSKGDTLIAWLSAVLFAVHPILIESVPAIDRRHDVLATLLLVASFLMFLESRSAQVRRQLLVGFSVAAYLMALGSKEIAIVLPGLVLSYAVLHESGAIGERLRSGLRVSLPFAVTTLCYLTWRLYVLGGLGGYQDKWTAGSAEMLTYMMNVIQSYVQDLVYPVDFLNALSEDAAYNLTPLVIFFGLGYLLIYLWIIKNQGPRGRRLPIFLGTWLLLPLALFLATTTFSHRSMYLPAVPFCCLMAVPLVGSLRWLSRTVKELKHGALVRPATGNRLIPGLHAVVLVLGLVFVCSLTVFSPILQSYDQWGDSAKISHLFLKRLCDGTGSLAANGVIHIYNLPDRIQSYIQKVPHAKEVTYLQHYSIKSWLNMQRPGNRLRVIIHTRSWPLTFSGDLDVSIRFVGKEQVWALVKLDKSRPDSGPLHVRLSRN